MGFQPPVPQQDTNWEIRAAVLASLALQILLIFLAPLRRRSASRLPRFVVWSGYLLADWVADLALGLLLNTLGNIGSPSSTATANATSAVSHAAPKYIPAANPNDSGSGGVSSPVIFAFWAPFLLLHLGGPDTITAFSVEDNELWPRHLIGLLFELFAAATVFVCSLRGNPFIIASVFMFVVGIVKYGERTYCLYRGSADGLRNSMLGDPDPGPNYAKIMEEYDAKLKAGLHAKIDITEAPAADEAASADTKIGLKLGKDKSDEYNAFQLYQTFQHLFADLILSFSERKVSQVYFSQLDAAEAFNLIEVELGFVYDVIYTKATIAHRRIGYALRLIGSACIITALLVFFFVDKREFMRVDVAITYALLVGAVVLDAAALVMLLSSDWTRVFCADKPLFNKCCLFNKKSQVRQRQRRRWSEKVSQLSLIAYCLDEPVGAGLPKWAPSRLVSRLADKLGLKEVLDETLYVKREKVTGDWKLEEFVFEKLKEKAEEANIGGYEKIKEVCEQRGGGALKKLHPSNVQQELTKYVEFDFDHSLLMWHIATELCCHDDKPTPGEENKTEHKEENKSETERQRSISRALSEYLVYLLVMQPAMLSTAAGIGLLRYRDTCAEARRFFGMGVWRLTRDQACKRLIGVNTEVAPAAVKGDRSKSVLFDACILSKKLEGLKEKKWEVVSAVWAEMLAYAACHCRAPAHMRQLSRGGELATVVWLLMAHVGLGQLYQIQAGDARAELVVDK